MVAATVLENRNVFWCKCLNSFFHFQRVWSKAVVFKSPGIRRAVLRGGEKPAEFLFLLPLTTSLCADISHFIVLSLIVLHRFYTFYKLKAKILWLALLWWSGTKSAISPRVWHYLLYCRGLEPNSQYLWGIPLLGLHEWVCWIKRVLLLKDIWKSHEFWYTNFKPALCSETGSIHVFYKIRAETTHQLILCILSSLSYKMVPCLPWYNILLSGELKVLLVVYEEYGASFRIG